MAKKDKDAKALKASKTKKSEKDEKPVKKGFPAKGFPAKKGAKKKRKALPTWQAPADFKPHFLLVQFKTERDGLLGTQVKATRFQGRFDRDADDKKKFDLGAYDPMTLLGIAARVSGVTYKASNDKKMPTAPKERDGLKGANRLPPGTVFQVLIRVGKKKEGNVLTAGVKEIWQAVLSEKTGRMKLVSLDKKDPAYRLIRKAKNFLPAAFVNVQMPPKRSRRKTEESDED